MKKCNIIPYSATRITGGFWKQKQDMVRNSTIYAVLDRFTETGRFGAFECNWKEGEPNRPHHFWDSDVAKWLEAVAYLTKLKRNRELEKIVDRVALLIEKNQQDDGYFNIYYTVVEKDKRFVNRDMHELYCLGHLIEAAVAYYDATGKRRLLDAVEKYVHYVEKRFVIDKDTAFLTPGHEELELALVRLYEATNNPRYLSLASFFVEKRGTEEDVNRAAYNQSHLPVRQQTTAEGHAVRAVYLYTGMADVAYYTTDDTLREACERLFDNIVEKRMYLTGGIGSSSNGEAFTVDYDLPSLFAYTESCAALGLALFAGRMLRFGADSKYSDVIERVIYNGFMSSVSLDGRSFFYENPLEVLPYFSSRDASVAATRGRGLRLPPSRRREVFDCSCCPPNIARFIPSIASFLYTDDGETVYVHQFMQSETVIDRNGQTIKIKQRTAYPENGKVRISISGGATKIAVRIPGWYKDYKGECEKGYAYFDLKDGEELSFDFKMKPRFVTSRPESHFTAGRYALVKGPVVYCMEGCDNGEYLADIRVSTRSRIESSVHPELGTPMLTAKGYRTKLTEDTPLYFDLGAELYPVSVKFIPYYAFANREECEMQVFFGIL